MRAKVRYPANPEAHFRLPEKRGIASERMQRRLDHIAAHLSAWVMAMQESGCADRDIVRVLRFYAREMAKPPHAEEIAA